jgi:hypothetical protein
MKSVRITCAALSLLLVLFALPSVAEIVYTQTNVSIPVGSSYNLDLNGDGVTDFTLRSKLLQGYCTSGDEFVWSLDVTPVEGNGIVVPSGRAGSNYASALLGNVPVSTGQSFYFDSSVMAELYWGDCGSGMLGQWLNLPDRYLGLQFQGSDNATHYGWAKLSTLAYVDGNGHLHATTILTGFAYETVAGVAIMTGQTSGP